MYPEVSESAKIAVNDKYVFSSYVTKYYDLLIGKMTKHGYYPSRLCCNTLVTQNYHDKYVHIKMSPSSSYTYITQ